MTQRRRLALAGITLALTMGAIGAQAQWVMAARAVAGRVQQMRDRSQATSLGDKITQLVVASNLAPAPDATSLVVQGVLKVCKEMNVECTLEGQ